MMVLLAFGIKKNIKKIAKSLITFYIVTFLLGSILFGILFMTNIGMRTNAAFKNGIFYMNLSTQTLLLLLAVAFILFKTIQSFAEKWAKKAPLYVTVTIYQENKNATFFAIVDTANSLYDPFSKKPVIVAEVDCVREVLQKETIDFMQNALENGADLLNTNEKLHMIPFHSLGTKTGFLWGFSPQKVMIASPRKKPFICDAVIGIYPGHLSHSDEYKALMHPELIHH